MEKKGAFPPKFPLNECFKKSQEMNTYNGNAYKKPIIIHRHNLIFSLTLSNHTKVEYNLQNYYNKKIIIIIKSKVTSNWSNNLSLGYTIWALKKNNIPTMNTSTF